MNIGHGKFAKPAQGSSKVGTGNVSSSAAVPLDQQWEAVDMRYEECKAGREDWQRERQAGRQAEDGSRTEEAGQAHSLKSPLLPGTGSGRGSYGDGISCVKQMQMFALPWWAKATRRLLHKG